MLLQHKQTYLSITEFNDVDLPDFTILTGLNGSGKSHLLTAISQGSVTVDEKATQSIILFNYENFRLENEQQFTPYQMFEERTKAWDIFTQSKFGIYDRVSASKKDLGQDYDHILDLCKKYNKSIWELTAEEVEEEKIFNKLSQYKNTIEHHFSDHRRTKSEPISKIILEIIKSLPCSIDEISKDEFEISYKPYTFKNDFLPVQLGKVFVDYYSKYDENEYREYQNSKHKRKIYDVLSESEFIKTHGLKPWEIINKILKFNPTLPYTINSPEGKSRNESFQVKLVHKTKKNVFADFLHLSSGERVLMALVASIYKSTTDGLFPDILLLDEIDSSLHPSMIRNLLAVINDIFLENGVKVILVTHSPTTIALAPEQSIFVMRPEGKNRIVKSSRSNALATLTEGYATLEQGLKLFDEVARKDLVIISEGRNASYIRRVIELNKITDVDVLTGAEQISSKDQLKILFDFFSKVSHEKKVIFVWDCDASKFRKLASQNNTIPFVFEQNLENDLCKSGIENLFPKKLFSGFVTKVTKSKGKIIEQFDKDRKLDFERFVLARDDEEDFKNFSPLVDKIKEIVSVPTELKN